jgi:HSP20 family protein
MSVMQSRIPAVGALEGREFADELRRIFSELGRAGDPAVGECSPPLDVAETEELLEISMDLPGVDPRAVRVVIKGDTVLIAGEKAARRGRGDSSFHLVERGFGRFARTVRLTSACDCGRARASLVDGELRVTLPKIPDRRGTAIRVAVAGERSRA